MSNQPMGYDSISYYTAQQATNHRKLNRQRFMKLFLYCNVLLLAYKY